MFRMPWTPLLTSGPKFAGRLRTCCQLSLWWTVSGISIPLSGNILSGVRVWLPPSWTGLMCLPFSSHLSPLWFISPPPQIMPPCWSLLGLPWEFKWPPPLPAPSPTGSSTPPFCPSRTSVLFSRSSGWKFFAADLRPRWPPPGGMRLPSLSSGTSVRDSPRWWPIGRGKPGTSSRSPWLRLWRLRIGLGLEAAGLGWRNLTVLSLGAGGFGLGWRRLRGAGGSSLPGRG